ncbi:MAG: permease-like cell division protein FtsX [Clostridia bacterium]|nr:permease-like cell division protein FtsX [Clostridia bacterium]
MKRNGEMTVTAIITVSSCLLLFGVFMLFSVNINYIGEQIQNQCQIEAYIEFEATSEEEQAVVEAVSALDNVSECVFISKQEAMRIYRESLGADGAVLDDLEGEEFLRSSVRINMTDLEQSQELAQQLSQIPNIAKVTNRQDIFQRVLSATSIIRNGSLIAMLILLIVAIFIISSTIKLSVEARRDEVHIMKYVGATAGFIRRPFVVEGILTGIVGGIISLALVGVGYNAVVTYLEEFFDIFDLLPTWDIMPWVILITFVFGIIMGAIGSTLALIKHLKV